MVREDSFLAYCEHKNTSWKTHKIQFVRFCYKVTKPSTVQVHLLNIREYLVLAGPYKPQPRSDSEFGEFAIPRAS